MYNLISSITIWKTKWGQFHQICRIMRLKISHSHPHLHRYLLTTYTKQDNIKNGWYVGYAISKIISMLLLDIRANRKNGRSSFIMKWCCSYLQICRTVSISMILIECNNVHYANNHHHNWALIHKNKNYKKRGILN